MTEIVTKKFMKLGTVNIPVGTEISGLPENVVKELAVRGLADTKKEQKPHKKEKTEMGL